MRRTILLVATMILTLLVASGVALATAIGSAQAANKVVGPGESIQKAVNAADPGDTIVVRGVHREDVIIRKNGIKLRGDDAVIQAPTRAKADSPCSKFAGGPQAICILGDFNPETGEINKRVSDVSVSGFTIRGFKHKEAYLIDVFAARNTTVVGNRITGNVANGIAFGGSVNTTIANNHVIGGPEADQGIIAESSSLTKIVNNVVKNYVSGIAVVDSPGTKILSNVARRNEIVGIFLGTQQANAKVVGNDLSGSEFGIFVSNSQGGSFAANEVHNNCAGVWFTSDFEPGPPSGNFAVKGNTVKDNTRSCRGGEFDRNFSGIGIALSGASGMEVTGNHLSGNVPSGPTVVSGGIVVGVDPLFGGTTKPTNNSVIGNHFGRNKPDIFWDKSGSGNRFLGNLCDTSVPSSLCN
jgi:parallel beta-helix repeat protein